MTTFLIWSFEHQAWWKPGRWGYTQLPHEAGHYTEAEADAILEKANRYAKQVNECKIAVPALQHRWIPAIECPRCHWISYNFGDLREGYCAHCHHFHEEFLFA